MAKQDTPASRNRRELPNLRAENERLRGHFTLLSDLSLRITSSLDLPTVLQEVVDAACELTGARFGALGVFDGAGRLRQLITHGVTPEEREKIGGLPQGLGLLGWLKDLQQPLRLADLTRHPKSAGFPPHHPPMKTFLGAPIRHGEESLGNLYLAEKAGGGEFTAQDQELLVLFSAHAALAIHKARLHQAVEEERRRLEALVNASPTGVIVAEAASGLVVLRNRGAARIFGAAGLSQYSLEDRAKAAIHRRPDGGVYTLEELPLYRALHRGESSRAEEVRLEFPDGHSVPTLVNATPVYSASGEITGAIAISQDITPFEEVEQLRSEFLGIVSHELRTPLTAIKGSAATVLGSRRPLDAAETREFFQIIDEQADRL